MKTSNMNELNYKISKSSFEKAQSFFKKNDYKIYKLITILDIKIPRKRPVNFSMFIDVIVGQQLSSAAASTINSRILKICSNNTEPNNILNISETDFRMCGLSKTKILFIKNIAKFVIENPNYFDQLKKLNSNEASAKLQELKGIGIWSSNIICLFYLHNINIFPTGDNTLNKAVKLLYGYDECQSQELINTWSPYKSFAALSLWKWMDSGRPPIV